MMRTVLKLGLAVIMAIPVMCSAQNGDVLPAKSRYQSDDRPFSARTAKDGDVACVNPVTGSYQHHLWIRKEDLYRGSVCVFRVQLTKQGWEVWLGGISIAEIDSDAEFESLGYTKVAKIIP